MRKVKLKKIILQNFAGVTSREIDFSDHTEIIGRNESGKTTIGNAYSWLLSDKLMSGGRADGIRPKDSQGKDIDDVEITVTAVLDIDGREVEIQKKQVQNWNKKQGILTGNTNTWMINGIPKKAKEFSTFLEENIAPEDVIQFCTSAAPFLKLDSKKRREKLFSLIPDFKEDDVVTAYPELAPVLDILKDGTVDELISRCRYQLHGRGRGDKGLEGQLDDIPVRIDEANKQLADTEALNAQDRILDSDILYLKGELEKLESGANGYKAETEEIKLKMRQVAAVETSKLSAAQNEVSTRITACKNKISSTERVVEHLKSEIVQNNAYMGRARANITRLGEEWKKVKAMTFDEHKKVCAYCGQVLPEDKIQVLVADFENRKAKQLADIEADGNKQRASIEGFAAENRKKLPEIEAKQAEIEISKKELEAVMAEKAKLPVTVDMAGNQEYQELQKQLRDLEALMSRPDETKTAELKSQIDRKARERLEIQSAILADTKARERISELESERVKISQKIADVEKQLDMLQQFSRKRGELITSRINKMFQYVEWDLFDFTIDGSSYTEICEPKYHGIRYSQLLNGGARILTEADICNTFQKQNGVSLPVFLDNAEAITVKTRAEFCLFDFQSIFLSADECDFTVR